MKLLVGLDHGVTDRGAVRFAAWLRETIGESTEVHAVHFEQSPDEGLIAGAAAEQAQAVVLGRKARAGRRRLVLLGRVARRVLRHLPVPTFVVPPDFEGPGTGPIVLATDLCTESDGAAAFARRIAGAIGRPLLVVHVIENPWPFPLYATPDNLQRLVTRLRGDAERALTLWGQDKGLGHARNETFVADVALGIAEIAEREDASLVVCGSRRLSGAARIFTGSVGSTLAGVCTCPVAIVPPECTAKGIPESPQRSSHSSSARDHRDATPSR